MGELQETALRELRRARLALQASYVFALYKVWAADDLQQHIFEDLQHMLESRTENLSIILEDSLKGDIKVENLREQMLGGIDAVKINLKNLVNSGHVPNSSTAAHGASASAATGGMPTFAASHNVHAR